MCRLSSKVSEALFATSKRNLTGKRERGLKAYPSKSLLRLAPNSKTFDLFNTINQDAISAKTMNTPSVSYIKNPWRIFSRLKGYIDAAADYEPRVQTDLRPEDIRSKTLQLAIAEYTSPTQWQYLFRAIIYAKEHGIRMFITRVENE